MLTAIHTSLVIKCHHHTLLSIYSFLFVVFEEVPTLIYNKQSKWTNIFHTTNAQACISNWRAFSIQKNVHVFSKIVFECQSFFPLNTNFIQIIQYISSWTAAVTLFWKYIWKRTILGSLQINRTIIWIICFMNTNYFIVMCPIYRVCSLLPWIALSRSAKRSIRSVTVSQSYMTRFNDNEGIQWRHLFGLISRQFGLEIWFAVDFYRNSIPTIGIIFLAWITAISSACRHSEPVNQTTNWYEKSRIVIWKHWRGFCAIADFAHTKSFSNRTN